VVKTFSPTILGALDSAYTTSSPIRVPQFFRRTLVDVWRANVGDPSVTPRWIPIPAFAKAIKRTWADRTAWNHFGRPPAIPDIVEHCKDYRRELVGVWASFDMLGRARHRLSRIIQTVNEYETEDW
jgi:hypothetical protein